MSLESFLRSAIVGAAAMTVVVAILVIVTMERSSVSQGGRLFVAVAAIVVLGLLSGRYAFFEDRRRPLFMEGPGEVRYRRYLYVSTGLFLAAAAVLLALAFLLPHPT